MEAAGNVYKAIAELIDVDVLNNINSNCIWTKKSNIYRSRTKMTQKHMASM